jgi:hypothetical protein
MILTDIEKAALLFLETGETSEGFEISPLSPAVQKTCVKWSGSLMITPTNGKSYVVAFDHLTPINRIHGGDSVWIVTSTLPMT